MKNILKYLIPAGLGLIAGLILWEIQRDRISMDYELIESAPFPSSNGKSQYFILRLRNSGNKAIEKIALNIEFPEGNIESTSPSDSKIPFDLQLEKSTVHASIPLLNPNEILSLTITALGTPHIQTPDISARAKGVTATLRNE